MDISGNIFRPDVEPEHVASLFRDYTQEELRRNDAGAGTGTVPTCPLCNETFAEERELLRHCATCSDDSPR
jgi:hypothetical protein